MRPPTQEVSKSSWSIVKHVYTSVLLAMNSQRRAMRGPNQRLDEASVKGGAVSRARDAGWHRVLSFGAGALAAVLALAGVVRVGWLGSPAVRQPSVRFTVTPEPGTTFRFAGAGAAGIPQASISPDGRWLAFIGTSSAGTNLIWVGDLNALGAASIPSTDGAGQFFSLRRTFETILAGSPTIPLRMAPDSCLSLPKCPLDRSSSP